MTILRLRSLLPVAALCLACAVAAPARGAEDWRADFDETCARSNEAMSLSESELLALTSACDRLEKVITGLPETERKVYLRRLQMCRNLYQFVLDTKRNEQQAK